MNILRSLKDFYQRSSILNFNVVERDSWVLRQATDLPAGSRILDAGAGSCPYRALFAHCDYKTQDFTSLQGEQLSGGQYGSIDYVCDIASIPVEDGTFDAVLCSEVIEHVPDPVAVMVEFSRILKSGGRLLLTAPLGSGIHQEPYHFYGGYTPFWYDKVLSEAGFTDINVQANGGSLRAFSQEALRFMQMTMPFSGILPFFPSLLWLPVWLLLLPVLAGVIPLAAHLLDRFDHKQHFTVGYFITAVKG
ncbi:MAG: SAM-dependent methyltransferase [Zetaproteobacteria bacterium CG12_big_fil_rev_8_21_14_0_65_55_1124]|nr:MAG: SAM-dependent methyltransferase [Zetaproteobacteria bacterium CG1_02_55_237]PIS18321.1 MAG: SAM-dependent methyltransferase [Zetaproteobacteria bacterium CG08_land_8_20_14_0_20_55_17]PIW43086.1 MAG: SAM-dependent methyltransferase [Zetaproteobacteria bacterium CG12_big_fil_rev_8_21_14_0_65_55_1124]PIY52261.1 MAG: SAM-dependent methyltransferase [Zetaproteobacteria bacterium CG_4_10_14_0_8_um_filter_55_43]PIZ38752.1 MAG: SAM-dependent methyltransferase [Zetaproteobacteria bacterium CG_4_